MTRAALMRAPFALGDDAELSRLLRAAGLREIELHAETGEVRFASAEAFVRGYVAGSPLAPMVAAAPAPAYEELVREVEGALGSFMRADSLCFPIEAQLARCRG